MISSILKKNEKNSLINDKQTLENYTMLRILGRGGFGKVMQVKHRESGSIYAMKILKKSELQRRRQVI